MGEVLIGLVGGDEPQHFNLEDIKRGAVRDSGLFPELFKTTLPPIVSGALISGVERKLREHRHALQPFDFPVSLPPSILPRALEDSKEEQTDQIAITKGKLQRGFLEPVFNHTSALPEDERQQFLSKIAQRAQTDDIKNLILFADDRSLRMDSAFLDPLYGHLRDHSNAQVREIFDEAHETPGKRVKEVDGATLGLVNSVYRYHKVCKELSEKGIEFDPYQYMDTTLCFVPMLSGKSPLPEDGLVIKGLGSPRVLRQITQDDILKMAKGRIFTYDHFDRPVTDDFPDWVTIHALKRSVSPNQSAAEKRAYAGIDQEKARKYLAERHSPGLAMSAFAHMFGLSQKGEDGVSSRQHFVKTVKEPKTILTTGNFLGVSAKSLKKAIPINDGKRVSNFSQPFSLRGLEKAVHLAQGFAVVDPEQYPITEGDTKKYGNERNIRLIRGLTTSLVASYLITMSTQAGASQHIGRPHLVDSNWFEKYGLYHPDLCNLGLAGDSEKEAYWLYKSRRDIEDGIRAFDATTYQHNVPIPASEFLSEKKIRQIIGERDLGYVVSVYGSATGFADETYNMPKQLTAELSKLSGVTTIDGAGVRSAMKGMKDGVIEALKEGYNVRNIGVRSESDVSPLEGNYADYFNDVGYPLDGDSANDSHLVAADGQMHIINRQRILARQAAIAEVSHASVICDGGKGTVLEFFITALHNASFNITGKGLLNHSRLIPLVVLNRDIVHCGVKRGIFDALLEPWRDQAHIIGLQEFNGKNPVPEALDFLRQHATGYHKIYGQRVPHSFDLREQAVSQNSQSRSPHIS